ncbi:adenosine deaminase [Butyrivibrio sp. NC3005]|uniref:adenosine deaminase n=1 Tax=Butyrivibrio sp. NC3005 TaxID=1280685 RepID=UPI0004206141|nr:adenosine deaminase [Butyrivibrio sp. NC3005]
MTYFTFFFLDNEKDIIVSLYKDLDRMYYELETPNHHSGNLIRNLAKMCDLPLELNDDDMLVIRGEVPCFINGNNEEVYIFSLKDVKVADIYPDGSVKVCASIPSIAKTLMSQTRDYKLGLSKTIFNTFVPRKVKFRADLHTHMNGNISPDVLIALGIYHQIKYPLYYVKKLDLDMTMSQWEKVQKKREKVERQFISSDLKGKYLDRKIDDNTFVNFADLILGNINHAEENIVKIRGSLCVLKDGQAVFTNLEKVYLYRYVFTKGKESEEKINFHNIEQIPDKDVKNALYQMLKDRENPYYCNNTIFQDDLLWIARGYKKQGVHYAEISDTTLVKKYESSKQLCQIHEIMPKIYEETGVMIRFLAALRRIPLTIIKDEVTPEDYLMQNLQVLNAVSYDPYVAGCDFVGEEINDIITLKPVFKEIVKIAARDPSFVIRVHAGENDSQKDNIYHSIMCVKDSLEPGQKMPKMRLGHGLYTYGLKTQKGKRIFNEIVKNNIVLEFQISSNVRLNNLSNLDNHPLKDYLMMGVKCVQGTDGAALYGTSSIDEQLSLQKMLDLSVEELQQMKDTETEIIEESKKAYSMKKERFLELTKNKGMEAFFIEMMEKYRKDIHLKIQSARKYDVCVELGNKIEQLPWDKLPIIIMGGSFNSEKRTTRLMQEAIKELDDFVETLDPEEVFFVIGNRFTGYEKYLVDKYADRFKCFSIVPALITLQEKNNLIKSNVSIRVSTEVESSGIYKSFNYEIFERRPSVVIAFDGNLSGANMIQEAKNGKGRAEIFVWGHSNALRKKADTLDGYVKIFDEENHLLEQTKINDK